MRRNVAVAICGVNSLRHISGRYTAGMERVERLQALVDERFGGNQAEFARAIKRSPAVVWQYLSRHRTVGEKFARHVEASLRLPRGWLDGYGGEGPSSVATGTQDIVSTMPTEVQHLADRMSRALDEGRLTPESLDMFERMLDAMTQSKPAAKDKDAEGNGG